MRGEVLHYDEAQGFGFIAGSDGNRYTFGREDLRRQCPLGKGTQIEFQPNGARAGGVSVIGGDRPVAAVTVPGSAPGPTATAPPRPAAAVRHFGRYAVTADAPPGTSLWSYFWSSVTNGYADFGSRAPRKEYWGFALFWLLALIVVATAAGVAGSKSGDFDSDWEAFVFAAIAVAGFIVLTIIPAIAISVRRLHDIGLSGWFVLLLFVLSFSGIGLVAFLVLALIPSQQRDNEWGPAPDGVAVPEPISTKTPEPGTPR